MASDRRRTNWSVMVLFRNLVSTHVLFRAPKHARGMKYEYPFEAGQPRIEGGSAGGDATEPYRKVRKLKDGAYDKAGGYKAKAYDDRIPRCLQLLGQLAPRSLLDVGCGDGFFLRLAKHRGIGTEHLAGLEISASSIEVAERAGFDCRRIDVGEPFPFPDNSFEAVFAGEVIEHLANPDAMLEEVFRVLVPGGHLLLTTPNLVAWFNRILMLFGVTPMFIEHSYKATYGPAYSLFGRVGMPVGHLRLFTRTPLQKVLEQNGFECTWFGSSAFLPIPVIYEIDRAVARLHPRLGANIIVIARRPIP